MTSTTDVVERLRAEGFRISVGYLNYLLRDTVALRPRERVGAAYAWDEADIDALKRELRRRGRGPRAEGEQDAENRGVRL